MSCDEARQQLPDYTLGTLSDTEGAAVRRHLRGCEACRQEAARLDEGMVMFASAAHAVEPPPELKARVMSVLSEEWAEAPAARAPRARRPVRTRWVAAAAVALLAGTLTWGGLEQARANHESEDAASYRQFIGALGGRDVRTAILIPRDGSGVDGSAIMYDSDKGQSWILVLVRTLGYSQPISVSLSGPGGRSLHLPRPIEVAADGDGATWLVTSADLFSLRVVTLTGPDGTVVASGSTVLGHPS
jgi:hypothetical protein